jgi:hypothetical protein
LKIAPGSGWVTYTLAKKIMSKSSILKTLKKAGEILSKILNFIIYAVGIFHSFTYVTHNFPKAYSIVSSVILFCFATWFAFDSLIKPFREGFAEAQQE